MKAILDDRQRAHDPKNFMANGSRKPNPEVPKRVDILKAGAEAVGCVFESPADAATVCRGIRRLFARNDIWLLPEMPLRNGRRADLMGIDVKGRVVIVEVKVQRGDLLGGVMGLVVRELGYAPQASGAEGG